MNVVSVVFAVNHHYVPVRSAKGDDVIRMSIRLLGVLWMLLWPAGAASGGGYSARVTLPARGVSFESMPLVVTGRDFYRMTGAPTVSVPSLQVEVNGSPCAVQVDECEDLQWTAASDGVFDDSDELVFVVDVEPNRPVELTFRWLERRAGVTSPPPAGAAVATEVSVVLDDPRSFVELAAASEDMEVGLNAWGEADPAAHRIGNYGRGCFSVLKFRDKLLTSITSAWSNVLPAHPFGYGSGPHRWSRIEVVKRGPVRLLLATERRDYADGVRAEFAIYTRGPAVDVRYTLRYHELAAEQRPQVLSFAYPLKLGKRGDTNDVLLVPVADRVHQHRLTEADLDAFYPIYYQTPLPDEGWFAWVDTAEAVGLAVFYEKLAPIRDRAAWVDSRPPRNPDVRIRTTPAGTAENTVSWHRRSIHTARIWQCENRFVGLTEAAPERVRWAYHLWASPLHELGDVTLPEPAP